MIHRPLIAAIALVPLLALASQAATTTFQDIPPGYWGRRAAEVLAAHQILPGRTPVDFAGSTPLSRYELAWTLSHLYNVDGPPASFVVLSDMPPGHIATLEVQRAMGFGLLPARKPGHFEGDAPATRKEVIESLDALFAKDGIAAPARKTAVVFGDVKPDSSFGQAVDRIVNRYGLLEAKAGLDFHPGDSLTRYQFLAMIARAMRYLQPQIAKEIEEPPPTPPPASLPPGASPAPASTEPNASPGATPTSAPTPVPSGKVLRTRAWLQGEVLALFSEDLPTDPGLVVAGEQRSFSGSGLPGGGAVAEFWSGPWGGSLGVSSYYVGFDVPSNGKTVSADMLETFINGEGLYQIPLSPDADLGFGAAVAVRKAYNMDAVGSLYLTADKLYVGAGPALSLGWRLTPSLALSGSFEAYPLFESYILPTGAKSISRWGAYPRARLEYGLGGNWLANVGTSAFLSGGGGGMQTIIGFSLGVGTGF